MRVNSRSQENLIIVKVVERVHKLCYLGSMAMGKQMRMSVAVYESPVGAVRQQC